MMEVPSKSIRRLIKNISSNYIQAWQAEQDADSRTELRHLLWASRDIHRLLLLWVAGKSEVGDSTARSYAESEYYAAGRIRKLVAARAKR